MGFLDYLKDNALRRGKDDPLFKKGVEKLNEAMGSHQRKRVAGDWPLASDPDGLDVFSALRDNLAWAQNLMYLSKGDFKAQRYDGPDGSGWRFGMGVHLGILDFDPEKRAGSDGREDNDIWLEALHEPAFDWLAYSAMPPLWLDDCEQHYRRHEIADELPELHRHYHTGKLRGLGTWCAMAHLDPLVLRIRVDTHHVDRQRVQQIAAAVFERIDVEAFTVWRDQVRAKQSSADKPDKPADTDRDGGVVGSAGPAAPGGPVALPHPDAFAAGLDREIADPAAVDIPTKALNRAFSGKIESTHTIVVDGVGEGMRYLANGSRYLDVIRITDPRVIQAIQNRELDGSPLEFVPSGGSAQWSNFDSDAEAAHRGIVLDTEGRAFLVRVRGVKFDHVYRIFQAVIDRFG